MKKRKNRMSEILFKKDTHLVSKTDRNGNIIYCNDEFVKICGYKEEELLNKPHNIVRHPDMPKAVFKILWEKLEIGEEVFAYVINKTKQGDAYWVFANVTPSYDSNNRLVGYHSVRRSPKKESVEKIRNVYKELLRVEKTKGVTSSIQRFDEMLKGEKYASFIQNV
jgi:PAS domain S-box-containing protein